CRTSPSSAVSRQTSRPRRARHDAGAFAKGMTFEEWLRFTGRAESLAPVGVDIHRGGRGFLGRRLDWGGYLRDRYARTAIAEAATNATPGLVAARRGGEGV